MLSKLGLIFQRDKEEKEKLIYHMFYRRVYNTANYLLNDAQLAEDVAQETFISAFKNLDKMDNKEKLGSWLITICTNKAIDFLKKQKRWNHLLLGEVNIDKDVLKGSGFSTVEKELEKQWLREHIKKHIDKLHLTYKQVLILKYINELKEAEIAAELNVSIGTIKSRLYRAKIKLRESLLQGESQDRWKEGNL